MTSIIRHSRLSVLLLILFALLVQGCGVDTLVEGDQDLYCTAAGSVTAGDLNTPNSQITVSNVVVRMYDGQGPYQINLPNGTSVSSNSDTYNHPSSFNLTTGSLGGANAFIAVEDTETEQTASCILALSGSSTNPISLVASATSVVKGTAITVTATAPSVTSPSFAFSYSASSSSSAVTSSNTSNGVLSINSSVAQTVTVTVTMTSTAASPSSKQIVLTFTNDSGNTASVSLSASATSVAAGTNILLSASASNIINPVYAFSVQSSSNGTTSIFAVNASSKYIYAAQATTAVIKVVATGDGGVSAQNTITLTFVASQTVSLTAAPSAEVGVNAVVTLTASSANIVNPTYSFFFSGGNNLGAEAGFSGNQVWVKSSKAGTTVIGVRVRSGSGTTVLAETTLTIRFSAGLLTCEVLHADQAFYRNQLVYFYIASNTGEALRLTAWEPGEPWDNGPPSFPLPLPKSGQYYYFYASYSNAGVKNVRVKAESLSRPGTFCNGGAWLTDTVTIY